MNADATFDAQWQEFRRRQRRYWIVFLSYVPGVSAIGVPLSKWLSSEIPTYIVAVAWLIAIVRTGRFALRWQCPRCGRKFFSKGWYSNMFAKRCLHCGLVKWSNDREVEAPPSKS